MLYVYIKTFSNPLNTEYKRHLSFDIESDVFNKLLEENPKYAVGIQILETAAGLVGKEPVYLRTNALHVMSNHKTAQTLESLYKLLGGLPKEAIKNKVLILDYPMALYLNIKPGFHTAFTNEEGLILPFWSTNNGST